MFVYVCVHMHAHLLWCTCGGQTAALRSWLSLPFMRVPEIKLRLTFYPELLNQPINMYPINMCISDMHIRSIDEHRSERRPSAGVGICWLHARALAWQPTRCWRTVHDAVKQNNKRPFSHTSNKQKWVLYATGQAFHGLGQQDVETCSEVFTGIPTQDFAASYLCGLFGVCVPNS